MARNTGVTGSSAAEFVIDAGVVAIGGTVVGATQDGAQFAANPTFREVAADGQPAPFVGGVRLMSYRPTLTFKVIEFSQTIIDHALNGAAGSPAAYVLPAGAHKTVTLTGKKADGTTVTVTLTNAYNANAGAISMADDSEGGLEFECVGCYAAGSDTPPFTVVAA